MKFQQNGAYGTSSCAVMEMFSVNPQKKVSIVPVRPVMEMFPVRPLGMARNFLEALNERNTVCR